MGVSLLLRGVEHSEVDFQASTIGLSRFSWFGLRVDITMLKSLMILLV